MAKKGFDISEVFSKLPPVVPDSGTGEQIKNIPADLIDSDERNFYELSGIDELANNILTVGLMDPIRVRPTEDGRYTIVSGHRRRAAMQQLLEEGHEEFAEIPCIVSTSKDSPELEELKLIFANSDTRKLTPGETSRQAQRVERLLYDLKEQGYEFPGRMRDYVAKACNVSKTKLGNMKVIRERLSDSWMPHYAQGVLCEQTALTLTKSPKELQEVFYRLHQNCANGNVEYLWNNTVERLQKFCAASEKLKCPEMRGIRCQNHDRKLERYAKDVFRSYYSDETCASHCCADCLELGKCKAACPMLDEKVQEIKAQRKAEKKKEEQALIDRDRPILAQIAAIWTRFGQARKAAGLSVENLFNTIDKYYSEGEEKEWIALETGEKKVSLTERIPFLKPWDRLEVVNCMVKTADALGCSLDYLCLRTDVREMATDADPVSSAVNALAENNKGQALEALAHMEPMPHHGTSLEWHPGTELPEHPCMLVCKFQMQDGKLMAALCHYDGHTLYVCYQDTNFGSDCVDIDPDCDSATKSKPVCWIELEVE